MKFGQLIAYDMRNNFLKTLYQKSGAETNIRPSSLKQKSGFINSPVSLYV